MASGSFKNIHLLLSVDDIRKIDKWKAANGMKSRSEAIRSIIRVATSNGYNQKSKGLEEKSPDNFSRNKNLKSEDKAHNDGSFNDGLTDTIRKIIKEELGKIAQDSNKS